MTKEQRIIRKAVDELAQETPNLAYVRGLLDGLVEEDIAPIGGLKLPGESALKLVDGQVVEDMDEAAILDAKARAALASIKELGGDEV